MLWMAALIIGIMVLLLLLGFPMKVPLTAATLAVLLVFFPGDVSPAIIIQQWIGGITPAALVAVPMFILAAEIMTRGQAADRLLDMVAKFVGHVRGGLPMTTAVSCTLFGAMSGSTQATVVAIGGPLRPRLLQAGYPDAFATALIINAERHRAVDPTQHWHDCLRGCFRHIGWRIIHCRHRTRIADFGVILRLLLFRRGADANPQARFGQLVGTLAGTSTGDPAAGISRDHHGGHLFRHLQPNRGRGRLRAVCCVPGNNGLSGDVVARSPQNSPRHRTRDRRRICPCRRWSRLLLGDLLPQIPQTLLSDTLGLTADAGYWTIMLSICTAYFIGCMFVDPIVVILILTPIFHPIAVGAGIDPVLVGVAVTLQVAIGSATPPFGCDIFTAIAIFRRPYFEVIRGTPPFIIILLAVSIMLIAFPPITLFLRRPRISWINNETCPVTSYRFLDAVLLMMVLFNPLLMSAYLHDVMHTLSGQVFVRVISRAFLISGVIFVLFAWAGDALFSRILQVRFAAFLIFGGVVFLMIALRYIVYGTEMVGTLRGEAEHLAGAIAMPFMIGPGTISASVLIGARLPIWSAGLAIGLALLLSCLFLAAMKWLFDALQRRNERLVQRYAEIIGRASALIVGTIAVEMILKGVDMWLAERN